MRLKYFMYVILLALILTSLAANVALYNNIETLNKQMKFVQPENIAAIEAKLVAIPILTTEVGDLQEYDRNLAIRMNKIEESHKDWNELWKQLFPKR